MPTATGGRFSAGESPRPLELRQAAEILAAALDSVMGRPWDTPTTRLAWDVRTTVAHIADALGSYTAPHRWRRDARSLLARRATTGPARVGREALQHQSARRLGEMVDRPWMRARSTAHAARGRRKLLSGRTSR
jgi:hypothetical protein